MRLATFARGDQEDHLGVLLEGDAVLDLTMASGDAPEMKSMLALIDGGPSAWAAARDLAAQKAERMCVFGLADVHVRAPIPRPRKSVYCVGLNFRSHVEQNAAALNEEPLIPVNPLFFSKPVTAVIGPGEPIRHDRRLTSKLDWEVELAVVIGRRGTWIPTHEAMSYVFGYTALNDVSARDLQWRSSQFLYGKGQDSYCPIGPAITTVDSMPPLDQVTLTLRVNNEVFQREVASHMIFGVEQAISELSRGITLEPGDIISLGTPGGCGYQMQPTRFLVPGDVVECAITGIGTMTNPVVDVTDGQSLTVNA